MKQFLRHAGLLLATIFCTAAVAAPAGTLDPTFGNGFGTQHVGFNYGGSANDSAEAMVRDAAGRLYLIGSVPFDDHVGLGISRLHHDGRLDETFGNGGKVVYQQPAFASLEVHDAAMQPDGKIVVAGSRTNAQPYNMQMLVCRFESAGAIDVAFGDPATPGCRVVPPPVGIEASARAVAIQPNGGILLAGGTFDTDNSIYRGVIARLLPAGAMDPEFGNQGVEHPGVLILFPTAMTSDIILADIAADAIGRPVLAGTFDYNADAQDKDMLVARLHGTAGALDTSFNAPHGYATAAFDLGGNNNDEAGAVRVLADGTILIAGTATLEPAETAVAAAKYDSAGMPYDGFALAAGQRAYDICPSNCIVRTRDLEVADDGSFIIAGSKSTGSVSSTNFFAMRVLSNADRDETFGPNGGVDAGVAYVDFSGNEDQGFRTLLQGNRVLVSGSADMFGDLDFAIARLDHGIEEALLVTPIVEGTGGTLSPGGAQEVFNSDQVDFVVQSDPGFTLVQIKGCGGTLIGNTYTTAPITANCTVTAEFSPDLVLTYGAGPNGVINGESPQTVPYGESGLAVEAIADWGYHFVQWNDGSLANPRQDTVVTQNIDATASFGLNVYQVLATPKAGGTILPETMQPVAHGGSVQFVIEPAPGFAIGEMVGCPGTLQGKKFTAGPIFENCELTVSFDASDQMFSLQYLSDGHGSIDGVASQMVLSGTDGTAVTAIPAAGYQFVAWDDGMTDNPRQDTHVIDDIEVTAMFATDLMFAVVPSVGVGGGGSVAPATPQLVAPGEVLQFDVAADPGFLVQSVGGTCGGSLVGSTYTTLAIVDHCTVVASFVPDADVIFTDGFDGTP